MLKQRAPIESIRVPDMSDWVSGVWEVNKPSIRSEKSQTSSNKGQAAEAAMPKLESTQSLTSTINKGKRKRQSSENRARSHPPVRDIDNGPSSSYNTEYLDTNPAYLENNQHSTANAFQSLPHSDANLPLDRSLISDPLFGLGENNAFEPEQPYWPGAGIQHMPTQYQSFSSEYPRRDLRQVANHGQHDQPGGRNYGFGPTEHATRAFLEGSLKTSSCYLPTMQL